MFNETEKFVEANTQELAKDKWLCPLSGKKFRGPDFVRKHIFNKHMDKVEAVRMEVCVVSFLIIIIIITLYLRLSEFTRQQNWVRTRWKNRTDLTVLPL